MRLLGITIDTLSRSEVLDRIGSWLDGDIFHRIATVNPEFLVRAEKDDVFRQVLSAADLRLADGFGIVMAGWFRGERIPRFPGVDLMENLLYLGNEKNLSIYLAVREGGLSSFEEIKDAIQKRYPNISIDGKNMKLIQTEERSDISSDILLCNFGAPEQEIFLESLRSHPGKVKLAIGVGGSFDYLTGKVSRAPRLFRNIGIEWFWRLTQQPYRLPRIWNATGIFIWKVIVGGKEKDGS